MNKSHTDPRCEVLLIGNPEPARLAPLKEILATEFGATAELADDFEQLPKIAEMKQNWHLILVVVTSPTLSVRDVSRLTQHFRLLGERSFAPPVCFIGPGRCPDVIGIQQPLYSLQLQLRPEMSAEERRQIIARLKSFIGGYSQSPAPLHLPVEVQSRLPNKSLNDEEDPIDKEITACLAEIKRLNDSIPADRREIERLKSEKQASLEALNEEMGRYREYVGKVGETLTSDPANSDTDP